ncbi:MAG: hypothetical protein KDK39_14115, partial [Leptospiraceae bacterium]|nr:hypothetical protein [Leptospiraceae bacterium]
MTQSASNAPTILLEQANPYETRVAQLESDGRTLYLYLSPVDDLPGETNAVWVRNLIEAPADSDRESMQAGQAPLQKKAACKHPAGLPLPAKNELDLVWFAEGTGVALYYQGALEAVVPPWSGLDRIQGYAREALELDVATLPLPQAGSPFLDRLQSNLDFWTQRSQADFWPRFRDQLLAWYEERLGRQHRQYFALERKYPPMAVVEFDLPDEWRSPNADFDRLYLTLGMSYQPMPGLERSKENAASKAWTEIITKGHSDLRQLPGYIGRMALYPWLSGSFFFYVHVYESGQDGPKSDYIFSEQLKKV